MRSRILPTDGPRSHLIFPHFKNRKDMMFYSLAKIDSLSEAAGELMENEKLRSEIRDNAYQTFCAGHTWRARAKEILSWEAED